MPGTGRRLCTFAALAAWAAWVPVVWAQDRELEISMFGGEASVTLSDLFANVVSLLVGVAGPVLFVLFLYGAFLMIGGAGKEDWAKRGKSVMVGTLIGMGIIIGSYGIMRMLYYVIY